MVLLSTAAVGIFSFVLHRADSVAANAARARDVAETVAAAANPAAFREALDTGEENEFWYSFKAMLDGAKKSTDVAYLYVLDSSYTNTFRYFAEGYDPATDPEEEYGLGALEDADLYAEEMFETLRTGEATVTGIYPSGEYGRMVSGFAAIKDENGAVIGVVGVDLPIEDVLAASDGFGLRIILIVLGLLVPFGLFCVWMMRRQIGKPIGVLTEVSGRIALGDLDARVDIQSNDEIGRLAESFRGMVSSTRQQVEALERLADGDLSMTVTPRCDKDAMSHAMNKMMDNLNGMFEGIHSGTLRVSAAAAEMASGAQNLADGASEQAAEVEQLVAEIAEVAEKTRENSEMAGEAASLAGSIKQGAEKGARQMEHMVQAVRDIDEASRSIGRVMKTIDDIAFQTNILALNAAVEAARAGQHGKGFAVVADEVRSLAAKSAASAKDTAALINDSVAKAALGVQIAGETSASLDEIIEGVNQSSRIVTGIAEASQLQSDSLESISAGIGKVSAVVQQNSATAEESAAASAEMSGQAAALDALTGRFKLREGGNPQRPLLP